MKVAICGLEGLGVGDYSAPSILNAEMGANVGNLLFWNAVRSLFKEDYEYLKKPGREWLWAKGVSNSFDLMVCPMANHLDVQILKPGYVNYLAQVNLPLLILGLGTQLASNSELSHKISECMSHTHFRDFIAILNEKAPVICMRGKTSAEFLSAVKYKGRIEVTGCPSQSLSSISNLGEVIASRLENLSEMSVNGDTLVVQHCLPQRYDTHLLASVSKVKALFEGHTLLEVQQSGTVDDFRQYQDVAAMNFDENDDKRSTSEVMMFFNLECWCSYLRKANFSIGTRIHGNILATQLGLPSLLISHDERVRELANQLLMPFVDIHQFEKIGSVKELLSELKFDGKLFDDRRKDNLKKIKAAIETVGLTPSDKLNRISD